MARGDRSDTYDGEVDFDDLVGALANIQRRTLLVALLHHNPQDDEPVVVDTDETEDEEFARLIEMTHVHLPKLEAYGFITWNRETKQVSKGPNFEEIRPVLELLEAHEDELPSGWR